MALVPLDIPPGVVRRGTPRESRGRWYDASLVRWAEGTMQPVGPWRRLLDGQGAPVQVGGPVRGMLAWRANDGSAHLAIGTPGRLYHLAGGTLTDITPAGLVPGEADAAWAVGAYGEGLYGEGLYGEGDATQRTLIEAQTWQLDAFGEDLMACAYSDGRIYRWRKGLGIPGPAEPLAGAPAFSRGVVVTPERFVVALAAGGDARLVAWSDQEDPEAWDPSPENQAGWIHLATAGQIMAGRRSREETLIWTDLDLWALRYVGGSFVYSAQQLGTACGAASRLAMATAGTRAVWMGRRAFYAYDGYVQRIPCDVADYVFGDLNRDQASKIAAVVRADFDEVTWYYPSAGSIEVDRYVTLHLGSGTWSIGRLERTSGVDRGPMEHAVEADAVGRLYEHEVQGPGAGYLDTDGVTELIPYAETGPFELGEGDRWATIQRIIPDERTEGGVEITLLASDYPGDPERVAGPFPVGQPTFCRVSGRQIRLRLDQREPGWRFGPPRLDVTARGRR